MDKFVNVLQCILPILAAALLGALARRKQMLTKEQIQGLQQYAMKFGIPCVLFISCLQADISAETVGIFGLMVPFVLLGTLWAFRYGRKHFPYHNLPMLFCAQENGMLGIPLFMILFGSAQSYHMGILDIAQMPAFFPTIAILSATVGENPSKQDILKKAIRSPLLIMSALGLFLNFSGIAVWLERFGITGIVTETASFLTQPISALMIFCVGYNFSMDKRHRKPVLRISALHLAWTAGIGGAIQLLLLLFPHVNPLTRWAVLLFTMLPPTYIATTVGHSEEDYAMASGVCSILTLVSLLVFCIIAIIVV